LVPAARPRPTLLNRNLFLDGTTPPSTFFPLQLPEEVVDSHEPFLRKLVAETLDHIHPYARLAQTLVVICKLSQDCQPPLLGSGAGQCLIQPLFPS